ncbi:MAG: zinc ribbon domain-containing protein [Bacteroidota bacterium]
MPIFEYKCTDCEEVYDVLHKGAENPDIVQCPSCESHSYVKKFSSFSASTSGGASSASSCESGNCGVPSYSPCANGMCGLG